MALSHINHRRKPLFLVPGAFSSSSSPPFPPSPPNNDPDATRPASSPSHDPGAHLNISSLLFRDIREHLQSSPTPPPPRRIPMNPPRPNSDGDENPLQSLTDIRRMLQNFRPPQAGSGAPFASESASGATPSFQDLLKNSNALRPDAGNRAITSFDAILDSLKLGPQKRPPRSPTPFLSPQAHSIFDKERDGKAEGSGKDKDSGMVLIRSYSYEDLGKRLGKLRPANMAKDGKEWFSLEELQGRIAKLAKLEEQDDKLGGSASELRKSILSIKNSKSTRVPPPMQMALLGSIGGQSMLDYMRLPPQEELLERYFHLDHMSSEEKMKLEL